MFLVVVSLPSPSEPFILVNPLELSADDLSCACLRLLDDDTCLALVHGWGIVQLFTKEP